MKRFISNLLTVCFICYMILLVYFLFFSEEYGRNTVLADFMPELLQ